MTPGDAAAPAPRDGPTTSVYGPATPQIRRFLVQLAGLGADDRQRVVARYAAVVNTPTFVSAETAMGLAIERAARTDARDAIAGPLLQLVRTSSPIPDDDPLASLEPVAEPALAAVLALLVADLLPAADVHALYAPFADVISLASVTKTA